MLITQVFIKFSVEHKSQKLEKILAKIKIITISNQIAVFKLVW